MTDLQIENQQLHKRIAELEKENRTIREQGNELWRAMVAAKRTLAQLPLQDDTFKEAAEAYKILEEAWYIANPRPIPLGIVMGQPTYSSEPLEIQITLVDKEATSAPAPETKRRNKS